MNYLILRTPLGLKYARRIADELRKFGNKVYIYKAKSIELAFKNHPEWNKDNLIIHCRAADPNSFWMEKLEKLLFEGYRIVNHPTVLKLTSDKYRCMKTLEDVFPNLPRTFLLKQKGKISDEILDNIRTDFVIIKPRYSQGGGKFVEKIHKDFLDDETISRIKMQYSCSSIIQEFVSYEEIYRVFVINSKALPVLTMDTPSDDNWKVSVCLNPWQVPINFREIHADKFEAIRNYAEEIQYMIGGEINFIDVFSTENGPVLSEINTACSLLTHERILNFNIAQQIAEYLNNLK